MRIVCIIQARLGSTRLPAKVLRLIQNRPMLSYMIERVRQVKQLHGFLIATTKNESDNPIVAFCEAQGVPVFRGDENDVLDRYYQAAKFSKADVIVRLTADCPLIDPAVVDQIIAAFLERSPQIDFVGNVKPATFPDGMDTEVFSFKALERAWEETKNSLEREHVTPYFYDMPGRFQTLNIEAPKNYSHYRVTVDYENDFEAVSEVLKALHKPGQAFGYQEIVTFLDAHPRILQKNNDHQRNSWYDKYQESMKGSK